VGWASIIASGDRPLAGSVAPVRLLFLTTVFPTPFEPAKGPFNLGLVRALAAAGHEVRVVAPVPWTVAVGLAAPTAGRPEDARVPSDLAVFPTYYFPPRVLRGRYGSFLWLSVRRTVEGLLETLRPDAVLGYWAHPDGEAAVRAAAAAHVPALVIVGGSDVLLLAREPARRRHVLRVLHSADAVLPVGADLRRRLVEMGLPGERLHVLQRGVDESIFHPGETAASRQRLGLETRGALVVWVGRMVPVKGVDVLLEACRLLRDQGVEFRLALVGDGPLRRDLETRVSSLGLDGRVVFAGSVAHEKLGDWYRAGDVTVLPSRSEGIPNVLLESLACGRRFVASRVGSVGELTDDPQDLVEPGDASELAAALRRALESPRPARVPPGRLSWASAVETVASVVEAARQGGLRSAASVGESTS
jgi:teichuronic acid biosynthesis glycosyltransferase TuaC